MSDFQTFELHDLEEREIVAFPLADLPAHVEAFGFILGIQRRTFPELDGPVPAEFPESRIVVDHPDYGVALRITPHPEGGRAWFASHDALAEEVGDA